MTTFRLGVVVVMGLVSAGCEGEVCDDNVDNDNDGFVDCADAACGLFPACNGCGDGVLDDNEGCDDGNVDDGDDCNARCQKPDCGNGVVDVTANEECDDGDLIGGDGCNTRCEVDFCGDGNLQNDEECDDGNRLSGDGCTSRCKVDAGLACGNFQIDRNEQCDDGNTVGNDGCSPQCRAEFCGDLVIQSRLGEQCDGSVPDDEDARCINCRIDRCGNGDLDANEECDDGNDQDGDGCTRCFRARCGNGFPEGDEECDDANFFAGDGCSLCRLERCGDGIQQENEVCEGDDPECVNCFTPVLTRDGVTLVVTEAPRPGFAGNVSGIALIDGFAEDRLLIALENNATLHLRRTGIDGWVQERFDSFVGAPVVVNGDGAGSDDLAGCRGVVVFLMFQDGFSNAEGGFLPCQFDIVALSRGVITNNATTLFTQREPSAGAIRELVVDGGIREGRNVLAGLRGTRERMAVLGTNGAVQVLDIGTNTLAVTALVADAIYGFDEDGDGEDEVVGVSHSVGGDIVDFGDRQVVSPVVATNVVRGDVDHDTVDDFVIIDADRMTLLLSTNEHAPLAPLPVLRRSRAVVDEAGDLLLVSGSFRDSVRILRYSLTP